MRAVILAPTRELALQTMKFFKELAKYTDLYGALLVGGDDMEQQFEELAKNPDVLIATPGRLVHHLVEVRSIYALWLLCHFSSIIVSGFSCNRITECL